MWIDRKSDANLVSIAEVPTYTTMDVDCTKAMGLRSEIKPVFPGRNTELTLLRVYLLTP